MRDFLGRDPALLAKVVVDDYYYYVVVVVVVAVVVVFWFFSWPQRRLPHIAVRHLLSVSFLLVFSFCWIWQQQEMQLSFVLIVLIFSQVSLSCSLKEAPSQCVSWWWCCCWCCCCCCCRCCCWCCCCCCCWSCCCVVVGVVTYFLELIILWQVWFCFKKPKPGYVMLVKDPFLCVLSILNRTREKHLQSTSHRLTGQPRLNWSRKLESFARPSLPSCVFGTRQLQAPNLAK